MPRPLFLGTNIPWNRFGYDIGGGAWDRAWFDSYFRSISGAQNIVRFFLHCDGRATPHFDKSGSVIALAQPAHAADFGPELAELVSLTRQHKLVLQIALWSFDMCKSEGFPIRSELISDSAKTQSYVQNALRPFLVLLDDTGCEHCIIEVMNEPEWCVDDPRLDRCPGTTCVTAASMQAFIATIVAEVHAHSSARKVTVGSASLKWSAPTTNGRSVTNLWGDAELLAAGRAAAASGRLAARPTLDLWNSHFWNWQERSDGYGPCNVEAAAFWQLDASRPLVFAELPAHIHSHVDRYSPELLGCLLERGFHGGLFWAYNDPGSKLEGAAATLAAASRAMPSEASYEALMAWVRAPTPPHPPPPPPPSPAPPRDAAHAGGGSLDTVGNADATSYTACKDPGECSHTCEGSTYTFCWTFGLPTFGGVAHPSWQAVCWGQLAHPACAGVANALPPPDGAPGQCYSSKWRQYPCPTELAARASFSSASAAAVAAPAAAAAAPLAAPLAVPPPEAESPPPRAPPPPPRPMPPPPPPTPGPPATHLAARWPPTSRPTPGRDAVPSTTSAPNAQLNIVVEAPAIDLRLATLATLGTDGNGQAATLPTVQRSAGSPTEEAAAALSPSAAMLAGAGMVGCVLSAALFANVWLCGAARQRPYAKTHTQEDDSYGDEGGSDVNDD